MMLRASKRALIELIDDLVNEPSGSWKDKRNSLLELASESEHTSLIEFASWFDPDEEAA